MTDWAAKRFWTDTAVAQVDGGFGVTLDGRALRTPYGDSDLICYRASHPDGLVERQNKDWDPLVDWSATALKAPLQVYVGVMHAEQPTQSIAALSQKVHALDAFRLAAFHDLVSLSGSLIIGFAATETYASAADEEAEKMAAQKRDAFLHADSFFRLCA